MTNLETQTRRKNSRVWSESLLAEAGFRRLGNTSLFRHDNGSLVLSPGVGPGGNGRYWFDLREANLRKVSATDTPILLRIVDRGFVLIPLSQFRQHLNDRTRRLTKAGSAYGFNCFFAGGTATLKSSSDSTYSFSESLLDRLSAAEQLSRR